MSTFSFFKPGHDSDRISGKLIQSSILEFKGTTQAVFLEYLENLSEMKNLVEKQYFRNLGA